MKPVIHVPLDADELLMLIDDVDDALLDYSHDHEILRGQAEPARNRAVLVARLREAYRELAAETSTSN